MPRFDPDDWVPAPIEMRCLRHLDSVENWEAIIKRPRPDTAGRLPWRASVVIFGINIVFFGVLMVGLLSVIAVGTLGWDGAKADAGAVLGFAAIAGIGVALYSGYLYRRSWNRRAAQLRRQTG